MSLNWDITNVKDHKSVCWLPDPEGEINPKTGEVYVMMNPVTKALIFATMSVDIGRITEDNADEFYARLGFFRQLWGPFVANDDGSPREITPQDVQAHIGLVTNVNTLTRAKWLTKVKGIIDRDTTARVYDYKDALKSEIVTS